MDFARKQMEKYGWKDGQGLGKDGNSGITVALKPHYKTGKEGMGFDFSKELVDTWWTRVYSDSLSRVKVDAVDDGGPTVTTCEDASGADADRPMAKMRKRMLRANFTEFSKGATLSNGELVEEETVFVVAPEKSEVTGFQLTDDELFRACGGRTAHKAARFGMKLNGKLARIASQEDSLCSLPNKKGELLKTDSQSDSTSILVKQKSKSENLSEIEHSINENSTTEEKLTKQKSKESNGTESEENKQKSNRKNKKKNESENLVNELLESEKNLSNKKSKRKKKIKAETIINEILEDKITKRKLNRKDREKFSDESIDSKESNSEDYSIQKKKSKKSLHVEEDNGKEFFSKNKDLDYSYENSQPKSKWKKQKGVNKN